MPPTTPGAPPANPPLIAIDAFQQARNLRQVLEEGKQRIGCFLGAGCPLGIYDAEDKKSLVLIPAVEQLTKQVALGLEERDKVQKETTGTSSKFKTDWDFLRQGYKSTDATDPQSRTC